jgi:hypothetical protein
MAKLSGEGAGQAVRCQHRRFGDVAAVWSILDGLDVIGLVDDVVARHANAGASVGTYLALATLNRVVDPRSKRAFADWWTATAGPRWVKVDAAALDHRRFWDAMDRLREDDLHAIETSIYGGMIDRYGLDLAGMALDMTNFATYIDSTNSRAPIAQRGKGHAETHRSAAGRPGPGRHPRRRYPDRLARLPRRPPARHPVQHRARRTGRPLPAAGQLGRVADRGLRRRAELGHQP